MNFKLSCVEEIFFTWLFFSVGADLGDSIDDKLMVTIDSFSGVAVTLYWVTQASTTDDY